MRNDQFVDFLYLLLFGRHAEPQAIEHWTPYLDNGLAPLDLFEQLWRSAEFRSMAAQNVYVKEPAAAVVPTDDAVVTEEYRRKLLTETLPKLAPLDLLQLSAARGAVAQWRYRDLMQANGLTSFKEEAAADTIDYNAAVLQNHVADERPNELIRMLPSIGRVAENMAEMKVLSIGARTEIELFDLIAAGFAPENISAIDLLSYSPLIRVGDMHAIPYPDSIFDIIVLGYTIAYSNTPRAAIKEMVRVAKPSAIMSVGNVAMKGQVPRFGRPDDANEIFSAANCDELLRWFVPHVGRVYFRNDPENPRTERYMRVLATFEIVK